MSNPKSASSPFVCSKCKQKFQEKYSFLKHFQEVHPKELIPCNSCNFKGSAMTLNDHLKSEHNAKLNCNKCDAKFENVGQQQSHIKNRGNSLVTCTICPFKSCTTLKLSQHHETFHKNSSNNGSNSTCTHCKKKFANDRFLTQHVRAFHPKKPEDIKKNPDKSKGNTTKNFKCTKCNVVFSDVESWVKHIKLRGKNDKILNCSTEKCTFGSCTKEDLETHIKNCNNSTKIKLESSPAPVVLKKNEKETDKKIKCDNEKCHLDFESEKDLQIHIKKRGKSVKLHTCQRCYFVSCTKIDFDNHIKKATCSRVDSSLQPEKSRLEKSNESKSITNDVSMKNARDKENIDDIKDFIDKTNPKKKDDNNKKTTVKNENLKKNSNAVSKKNAIFREAALFASKAKIIAFEAIVKLKSLFHTILIHYFSISRAPCPMQLWVLVLLWPLKDQ